MRAEVRDEMNRIEGLDTFEILAEMQEADNEGDYRITDGRIYLAESLLQWTHGPLEHDEGWVDVTL